MEIQYMNQEITLGNLVRVELSTGITHYQAPEALDVRYPQSIRAFCEKEKILLPSSFRVYERAAAKAALIRVAEKNQNLDILASIEALRAMSDGEYDEYYIPSGFYICERYTYVGRDRYEESLAVSLEDGTATVNSTWGSMTYWDRFVYPPQGEPYYAGTVDGFRVPPSWIVEKPRK